MFFYLSRNLSLLEITGAGKDCENVLNVPETIHTHYVEPHADWIMTKVITNNDNPTIHSLTKLTHSKRKKKNERSPQ